MFCSVPVNGALIAASGMWVIHTPYKLCSLATVGLCIRSTFLPKEPPNRNF